jgi:hypothetical protein
MLVNDVGRSQNNRYTHCEIHPAMTLGVCAVLSLLALLGQKVQILTQKWRC